MVFQQYSSFPFLTVLENVELGLKLEGVVSKIRKDQAMHMIEKVGEKLRSMMPWIAKNKLVDRTVN